MSSSFPQLPTSLKDVTLWLKYITLMALPVGLLMTIKYLIFGPRGWIIISLLTLIGSIYALRATRYFRQWNESTDITKLIAVLTVIGCIFSNLYLTVLVLIAIPFVKKFTDRVGFNEPPKLSEPYDRVLLQIRRFTNDPLLPTTKKLTAPPPPPAQPAPFRGKTWLTSFINTPPFPDDFSQRTAVYKIMLPKPTQWRPERALQLMEHLMSTLGGCQGGVLRSRSGIGALSAAKY